MKIFTRSTNTYGFFFGGESAESFLIITHTHWRRWWSQFFLKFFFLTSLFGWLIGWWLIIMKTPKKIIIFGWTGNRKKKLPKIAEIFLLWVLTKKSQKFSLVLGYHSSSSVWFFLFFGIYVIPKVKWKKGHLTMDN